MPPSPPPWLPLAALAVAVAGWGLSVAAVAAGVWGMGGGQRSAVTAVIVTRGLWADCGTDASGVTSCEPLVSLLSLPGYLHGGRALAVLGAALGALGGSLGALGGSRRGPRAAGGALLLLAGLCAVGAALWFGLGAAREFFDPNTVGVRFEPGPAVLEAGGGGALQALGGGALLWLARPRPAQPRSAPPPPPTLGEKYGRNEYV